MNRSRIMDTLAKIIAKQDRETPMNSLNGDKIEKIITSLLSSPCNYTPLLHFVIPRNPGLDVCITLLAAAVRADADSRHIR